MPAFAELELGRESPMRRRSSISATLLDRHDLTKAIFTAISEHLAAKGELLRGGTIMDAPLIAASPSTKNREQKRDPEMSSSKRENQWYFGMKAHVGVDAESRLVQPLHLRIVVGRFASSGANSPIGPASAATTFWSFPEISRKPEPSDGSLSGVSTCETEFAA